MLRKQRIVTDEGSQDEKTVFYIVIDDKGLVGRFDKEEDADRFIEAGNSTYPSG